MAEFIPSGGNAVTEIFIEKKTQNNATGIAFTGLSGKCYRLRGWLQNKRGSADNMNIYLNGINTGNLYHYSDTGTGVGSQNNFRVASVNTDIKVFFDALVAVSANGNFQVIEYLNDAAYSSGSRAYMGGFLNSAQSAITSINFISSTPANWNFEVSLYEVIM